MNKDLICGLDIGTSKLCLTCGTANSKGEINILASQRGPAEGMRSGRIVEDRKLSACIKEAVSVLRKTSGLKVRRIYANIDSLELRAKLCKEKVFFKQDQGSQQPPFEKLINSIISSNISLDRKLACADFNIDEANLKVAMVSAFIPTINSLNKSIKGAGLFLEELVSSGCAQAWGLFRNFKTKAGENNILIDFGAGLTKITLFEDSLVKDIVILPFGAASITGEIAVKLKVSTECAEQLKVKYGRIFQEEAPLNQKIIIKDKLIDRVIQLRDLYKVIDLKVDLLLREIKKALLTLSCQDDHGSEIIVTGGGSILEGFLEKAQRYLARPVKMGFLYAVKDNHIQAQSALYATSVGLIRYGLTRRTKLNRFYSKAKFRTLTDIHRRAKELYGEYF